MAAAEARVAWQRTANRYLVQEDAKRAPKLACCPSSSSSSEPQVDAGSGDAASGPENTPAGFVPLNRNPSNPNLLLDTKWWLHLQPNFGHQKELTSEHLNVLEVELETLRTEEIKRTSNLSEDPAASEEGIPHMSTEGESVISLDLHHSLSESYMKSISKTMAGELKAGKSEGIQKTFSNKDMVGYWCKDEKPMDIDPINRLTSKQSEKLFDTEFPWMGGEKTEPWWRTADTDELASLVAQKSLERVENCDLPPPQTIHVRKGPFTCPESFSQEGIFSSIDQKEPMDGVFPSFDQKEPTALCCSVDHSWGCLTCGIVNRKTRGSGEIGDPCGFDKSFSSHSIYSKNPTDATDTSESDLSKAQLMEALRHSQTRAREAENAAQEAYNEKEHIIKLFFRQASHLFAYKQWLQVLQLETICLQLKNKDQSISTLFPVFLPWMPYKSRQGKKGKHKPKKTKSSQPRYDISKYTFAFAVGLGLAGAGLLLGWTMGWLFPMF